MKHRGPPHQHRPNGTPFATKASELIRREMNPDVRGANPEEDKLAADLKSPDVEVRRAAAESLWRSMSLVSSPTTMLVLVSAVMDDDLKVRMDAAATLGKVGKMDRFNTDPYIARLAQRLRKDSDANTFERILVLEALARIGTPAQLYSKYIGLQLDHEEWMVRLSAVNAIGKLGPEQQFFRSVLVQMKRDENEEIRKRAEEVLLQKRYVEPGWLKAQNPGWRVRVLKAIKNKSKR